MFRYLTSFALLALILTSCGLVEVRTEASTRREATVRLTPTTAASPPGCGESLPLFPTVGDPEGTPGPGTGSLAARPGQVVAHWPGDFGATVELRWPATPPTGRVGDFSEVTVESGATRVVTHIRISEDDLDPCSLVSVEGYGPRIEPVHDQVAGFAASLVDAEGLAQYLADQAELAERRSREILCDQPAALPGADEMTVTLYEICEVGLGTGPRFLSGLQPVRRVVAGSTGPLRSALTALFEGPNPAETAAGFVSGFSSETAGALRDLWITDGTAVVDLDGDVIRGLGNLTTTTGGSYFRGQLYGTAFAFDSVTAVEILIDGSPIYCEAMELVDDCVPVTRDQWEEWYALTFDD